jgi:hypothetical protein
MDRTREPYRDGNQQKIPHGFEASILTSLLPLRSRTIALWVIASNRVNY